MIRATYYRQYNRMTVTGHAGSGPEGHDLVCAAASALILTLAGNVAHLEAQGAVRDVIVRLDAGDAEVQFRPHSRYKASVELVVNTILVGFELLSTKFSEHIRLEVRG